MAFSNSNWDVFYRSNLFADFYISIWSGVATILTFLSLICKVIAKYSTCFHNTPLYVVIAMLNNHSQHACPLVFTAYESISEWVLSAGLQAWMTSYHVYDCDFTFLITWATSIPNFQPWKRSKVGNPQSMICCASKKLPECLSTKVLCLLLIETHCNLSCIVLFISMP